MTTSRTITVLGSTGSVGMNTLNVIREHSGKFRVRGLAAGSKLQELTAQIEEFSPESVYLHDEKSARELRRIYGRRLKVFTQSEGLDVFTAYACSDILMVATSGTSALLSVIGALREGKRVALANKEILVAAGGLVMSELKKNPTSSLIPVDSEHSAIFQCLVGNPPENIERLILTGSGGPLREILQEEFQKVSKEVVTSHPRWKMGQKISVDSATLMNKGLEIIEASWLFGLPVEKIDVLIHPEAVIHSMVEFKDGAILAQLGVTDMRLPIQYALTFPERYSFSSLRLDWS